MTARRGFTLVELLVVIVILTILAALLFPVFQSVKETAKRATTMANYKQVATGMTLYINEYSDTYPLAFSADTQSGVWRSFAGTGGMTSMVTTFPAGWRGGKYAQSPRLAEDSSFWANALLPYIKSTKVFEASGLPHFRSGSSTLVDDYARFGDRYGTSSVTFNGLLHDFAYGGVASPSQNPMLWQGMFKRNYEGFARSNPELDCFSLNMPCRFNSYNYPQLGPWTHVNPGYGYVWFGAINPYGTAWVYGHGMHFLFHDGHARYQPIAAPSLSIIDTEMLVRLGNVSTQQPFSRLSSDPGDTPGTPFYSADCDARLDGQPPIDDGITRNITYDCFFRPDSTYDYTQATASDY